MKVLVIKLSALGDVVHAIPAINAIKKNHPDWDIDWLINDKFKDIIAEQKSLREIFTLKNKKLTTYLQMVRVLKGQQYDLVIDLQGLIKTSLIGHFIKSKKTKLVGFNDPREKPARFFYTDLVDAGKVFDTSIHIIEKNMLIAQYLGVDLQRNNEGYLKLDYGEIQSVTRSLDLGQALSLGDNNQISSKSNHNRTNSDSTKICLIPSTTWSSKLWTPQNWAYLIKDLIKNPNTEVYILGTDADLQNVNEIYDFLDQEIKNHPNLKNYINQKKLTELPEFFREMNLIIGVDTGPLHIAAASVHPADTQILGLFGPSSAKRSGPYGFTAINYAEMLGASPQNKRSLKADNSMLLIPKEEVFNIARALLKI